MFGLPVNKNIYNYDFYKIGPGDLKISPKRMSNIQNPYSDTNINAPYPGYLVPKNNANLEQPWKKVSTL